MNGKIEGAWSVDGVTGVTVGEIQLSYEQKLAAPSLIGAEVTVAPRLTSIGPGIWIDVTFRGCVAFSTIAQATETSSGVGSNGVSLMGPTAPNVIGWGVGLMLNRACEIRDAMIAVIKDDHDRAMFMEAYKQAMGRPTDELSVRSAKVQRPKDEPRMDTGL